METSLETFHPDSALKKLYYTYLSIPILLFLIFGVLPLIYFLRSFLFPFFIVLPFIIVFGWTGYWIPQYYNSLVYHLTESHLIVHSGVWFTKKKSIPLDHITDAEIGQGPLTRHFNLANINIQTAGRSGQTGSEAALRGLTEYEKINEIIINQAEQAKATPLKEEEISIPSQQESLIKELKEIKNLLTQVVEKL